MLQWPVVVMNMVVILNMLMVVVMVMLVKMVMLVQGGLGKVECCSGDGDYKFWLW